MSIHRFDPFTYDPASFRLSGPEGEVALEPKVAELLALLISERQRVVSRVEIFDSLWPNQVVGDAALSRLLYELRKALGDEATNSRYVRTVPRRGLQFIAQLEAATSVTIEPDTAQQPGSAVAPPAPVKRWHLAGAALLVIALTTALLMGLFRQKLEPLNLATSGVARIAILTGVAAGSGSQAAMVMVTVGDLLSTRLAALPGVEVRSPQYVEAASSEASSIVSFANQSQVDYVLSLNVAPATSPAWVRLQGELIQIRGLNEPWRTPLGRIELPNPASDEDLKQFLKARDQLVQKVADEIGVLVSGEFAGSEPRSLEAWRLYLQGKAQLSTLACDTTGTASLLQRAVELDPEFGAAWIVLGFAHYNQVWACGAGRETALKVLATTRRARELDPLIPGLVLLEASILTELGRAGEAEPLVRASLAQRPGNAILMATLSYVLTFAGQLDESAALLNAAVAIDPLVLPVEIGMTPNVFLHQGNWQRYLELGPAGDAPIERYYRAFAQWQLGNLDEAIELTEGCRSAGKADVFGEFCRVLGLLLIGETHNAATLLQALLIDRRGEDLLDGEIDLKVAQLLVAAGEPVLALEAAQLAWQRGFRCRSCFLNDPLLAQLRAAPALAPAYQRMMTDSPAN